MSVREVVGLVVAGWFLDKGNKAPDDKDGTHAE